MSNPNELPDILLFISDQHGYPFSGFAGDSVVRTPCLDRIAKESVCFDSAYTSCPLCVPARISLLTGQLPSKSGGFSNGSAIPFDKVTFLHSLAVRGYETVLAGRMHFMGPDQYHGFTKRIMGELLTSYWGEKSTIEEDLGRFRTTFTEKGCLKLTGGGYSPIQDYDKLVIQSAVDYLAKPHEKPQCIVVGTYGPHFSYVAPKELYSYYRNKVGFPHTTQHPPNYRHSALAYKEQYPSDERLLSARAAYYGMIENMDRQVGEVYDSFNHALSRGQRKGLFVYLSDHGDQVGERHLFGKQTFFEPSVKIPLLISGEGIPASLRTSVPVSICDVAPTLLAQVGATPLPGADGQDLSGIWEGNGTGELYGRTVFSEYLLSDSSGGTVPGRMLVQGDWKLISYHGFEQEDLLFNLRDDPFELKNICKEQPKRYQALKAKLNEGWDAQLIMEKDRLQRENHQLLGKWCDLTNPKDDRWIPHIPPPDPQETLLFDE